jgi:hypothetical protein
MSQLLFHIPLIAGSLVVGGVVIASGGSILQSGVAGITTGATGFATSALVTQSKVSKQKLVEQERDRLRLEIENQKRLLAFGHELEHLQGLRELLQQSIDELKQYNDSLNEDEYINPQSEESITTFDSELVTEQDGEESTKEKEQTESNTRIIVDFLESLGIEIKTIPTENSADNVINSLSKSLGENYDGLRELLARIKRNMQQGSSFSLSLKEYTQKDVSNVCQFCTRLHAVAFLEEYRYFRSPQYLIRAKATTLPAAHSFFSGKWLERFVLLSMQRCVRLVSSALEKEIVFSYLLNPQIILPNGDNFELDLVCHVSGFFFWIEAKSGDYQQHISKYSKMSKILNLDFRHSIMVLPDISEDRCAALTSLFSMTVCSLSRLEEVLVETIRKDQTV